MIPPSSKNFLRDSRRRMRKMEKMSLAPRIKKYIKTYRNKQNRKANKNFIDNYER